MRMPEWISERGPVTSEEWEYYRSLIDAEPAREWSAAEEKAFIRGKIAFMNRFFGEAYADLANWMMSDYPIQVKR